MRTRRQPVQGSGPTGRRTVQRASGPRVRKNAGVSSEGEQELQLHRIFELGLLPKDGADLVRGPGEDLEVVDGEQLVADPHGVRHLHRELARDPLQPRAVGFAEPPLQAHEELGLVERELH
eukprot:CAMPEP_0176259964 /NCGR_PEP_ID=MMETSP0121_2-20121125/39340_1 /TAXON_ID=160619 /ORGANISM="Kryptoperidinium foliaceum, Strain CCMP 1326" /LENGTH=120 /DNA_ID=CAMNT_0017599863 /DNA_START=68 /DNA_END=427 /DNA_ORIENTATION=-